MSAATDAVGTSSSGPPVYYQAEHTPSLMGRIRRRPLATASIVIFVALIVTLLVVQRPEDYTPLSTHNSTPTGTRALAQILRDQGVDVRQAASMGNAWIENPAGTTLAVTGTQSLAEYQVDALLEYPGDLVLIDPSQHVVDRVAPALSVGLSLDNSLATAQCQQADAVAAERVRVTGSGVTGDPGPDGQVCFPNGEGQHAFAVINDGERRVTLLPAWELVTNATLAEDGNAALGLRTLGRHPSLVWIVGDTFDTSTLTWSTPDGEDGGGDGGIPSSEITSHPDFLPPGTGSAVYVLGITVLLAAWWRARRFGPLVREPLPVIVRASEATRGRARLYRRARASGRATAAMRGAAALRMARRLGVPRAGGRADLVPAIARATGRSPADVDRVLYGPPPTDDATMMTIIEQLDTLEREVHQP